MLFVINPHKFMWYWKMLNTELVYSLLGFDTPTSGPTLTFSYLYSLYPSPLCFSFSFTNLHLYNSPAICHNLQFTTNACIQTTYYLFYSSISTVWQQYISPCSLHISLTTHNAYSYLLRKSLQLLFSTTLSALRPTHL